ncbi:MULTISPECIES: 2'-5' RNA ligase family protein [unclassified Nocardioides]|uniref:2'-5' RNA ligase family protein n=1 Tax=unclassified Nocardioides TaxID=2615069 RepID=UPI001153E724|nr:MULTISPECIES: 2'-5' RNA ligase family protein [unclassified Nocardioides]TQK71742.1 2'-5' RNA ligase superfamily protein [Nocardioides sp. SLBN-35]WGY04076.1 2'-5' RNA ligase family protein [Nocardioides sp. QY071]
MAHTVLVVPVPALEDYIRGRWEHYDAAWVSRDPAFTHAHITALAPFRPAPTDADLARVARIARTTPAFDLVLDEVTAFPDGIVHAVPSPVAPFAALTARLWEAFPDCPPYAGEFADVVPHLTLDRLGPGVSVASVTADLATTLPVRARAERLELHRYAERDCRVLASWSLVGAGDPVPQPGGRPGR